jgi:hypothetical protein
MTLFYYIGAIGFFSLGALCIRNTSPHSRVGGTVYERRKTRKIVGEILLIAGALMLGMAFLSQFFSSLPQL